MEKNYDEKSKLEVEELEESDVDNVTGGMKDEVAVKYGGPRPKFDHPLLMYGGKKPVVKPMPDPGARIMYGCPEPIIRPIKRPTEPLAPPTDDAETPKE